MADNKAPESFTQPYQIICEGNDDTAFFCRLIRNRNVDGFQVGNKPSTGKDTFEKRIAYIQALASVNILGYVIIADTDDQPDQRFKDACAHLKKKKLPVPTQPAQIARGNDGIKTAVWMVPSATEEGGLETLLLSCCDSEEANPHSRCVASFCDCVPNLPRKIDRDKVRLRALIASTFPDDDPGLSLTFWVANAHRPFEMTHPSLDNLYNFLIAFRDA